MLQFNMLEAKTDLSKIIKLLESKQEDVIYLARNNKIVADLTLHKDVPATSRIGVAKGQFEVPDEFDDWDSEIEQMFGGDL